MVRRKYGKNSFFSAILASSECAARSGDFPFVGRWKGPRADREDSSFGANCHWKEAVNLAVTNSRDLALARLQYGVMQRRIGVARSAGVSSQHLYRHGRGLPHQRLPAVGRRRRARDLCTHLYPADFQSAA